MSAIPNAWAKQQKTGSPTLKAVLVAIADYANEEGFCFPSQATIARDTELSERSVRTAIQGLEEQGYLQRCRRQRPDGGRSSDSIQLFLDRTPRKELPVTPNKSGGLPERRSPTPRKQLPVTPPEGVAGAPRKELPGPPERASGELPINYQLNLSEANASAEAVTPVHSKTRALISNGSSLSEVLWSDGLAKLIRLEVEKDRGRRFIGRCLRDTGSDAGRVIWAIDEAVKVGTLDPIPFITKLLNIEKAGKAQPAPRRPNVAGDRAEFLLNVIQGGLNGAANHDQPASHFGSVIEHESDRGHGGALPRPAGASAGRFSEEGHRRLASPERR